MTKRAHYHSSPSSSLQQYKILWSVTAISVCVRKQISMADMLDSGWISQMVLPVTRSYAITKFGEDPSKSCNMQQKWNIYESDLQYYTINHWGIPNQKKNNKVSLLSLQTECFHRQISSCAWHCTRGGACRTAVSTPHFGGSTPAGDRASGQSLRTRTLHRCRWPAVCRDACVYREAVMYLGLQDTHL